MGFNELVSFFSESIQNTLSYFVRLDKRIHFFYLLTSLILSVFVYYQGKREESFFKYFFKKKNWLSRSAFTDYAFLFFNGFVKLGLLTWMLSWGLQLQFDLGEWLMTVFGFPPKNIPVVILLVLYPLILLIVGDFSYYLLHLLYHKIPFLWVFHKVHHSSTAMNPITQYRIHPVELFLNNMRYILLLVLLNSLFHYLSNGYFQPYTYFGVNLTLLLFNSFGANLRHSHIKLTYFNWLEKILISPFQHQIHHSSSPKLFNKNMGSKLAIWDLMFGTLVRSKEVEELNIGLGAEDKHFDSFLKNLINPFIQLFTSSRKSK